MLQLVAFLGHCPLRRGAICIAFKEDLGWRASAIEDRDIELAEVPGSATTSVLAIFSCVIVNLSAHAGGLRSGGFCEAGDGFRFILISVEHGQELRDLQKVPDFFRKMQELQLAAPIGRRHFTAH